MSQKRVAVVLASLVGALTISALVLLVMENGSAARGGGWGGGNLPAAMGVGYWNMSEQLKTDVPLQKGAWEHIIIYESGDQAGSGAALADGRLVGGSTPPHAVRHKALFHFVNGIDGELETCESWRDQKLGAPHVAWPDARSYTISPYNRTVGVCFIGSLDRGPISNAQHQTLVRIVRELQHHLEIPKEKVWFQWELEPNTKRASDIQKRYADHFRKSMK
ncbi:MAG: hypothetical protein FWD53_00485 [Phycisphaerales bacterium]|nr:hypothetical protein [Phycisphaerales bacterium]